MNKPLVINTWLILAHPLFLQQLEYLTLEVAELRKKDQLNFKSKNATKKLAAINFLAFEKIPNNPAATEYRQGLTLGTNNTHWFRAKFFQQYRLFFRFHQEKKIIIYAWVNDESTKRAYATKTDAYTMFKKMLKNGRPPNNWDDLLKEAEDIKTPTPP
jgi:toxin YhaV